MINWDSTGTKGALGRFEIIVVPYGDGWKPVIWVQKILIATLEVEESKANAQIMATDYLEAFQRDSDRHLERIGYDK